MGGRYSLLTKLGEGGKGVVYKVHDKTLDRVVALKLLKSKGFDDDTYARFMREAQSSARLTHPNIVSVYDAGKDKDGRHFLVMEFVEGRSLRELMESFHEKGLKLAVAVRVATDVCKALSYAHSHGILHRDIKPENIMITHDGTAKLMDFGLAKAVDKPRLTREGIMVGTPAYMAPENALGKESDTRSDIYSLGCVLYEMLVGTPPFRSEDSLKTIYSHIHDAPVLPSRVNSLVPAALEAITIKAIMKDPTARFQAASDLLRSLEQVSLATGKEKSEGEEKGLQPHALAPTKNILTPDLRRTLPFIDRESELASLKSLLDATMRGEGCIVFLAGEAGIGKTRLAEELRTYAALRGVRTLSGRCLDKESGVPYSPWVQMMKEVINQVSPQVLRKASSDYIGEIAKLVPEVLEKIGPLGSSPGIQFAQAGQADQERTMFLEGIAQFFVNLSKESALTLLFDDLNSADTPSIQLLRHLARKLSNQSIMIIGTYRDNDLEKSSALFQLTLDLNRERVLNTVRLKPFDVRGLTRMIAETFGESEKQQTPEFRNLVLEKTGGNPFFVEEVLRSLVEQGVIFRTENGWERKAISEIEVPPTVRAVIEQRLSRLDEGSLTVLTAASVLGKEFSFELLQRVTSIDEETLLERIERSLKLRLLSEKKLVRGESAYVFTDLQVRDVLQEAISLVRRRKLHLRAGQAMEELYKDKIEEKASELAYHFLEGNDQEKSLTYCVKAGGRAAELYAHQEALKQFRVALELLEGRGGDEDVLLKADVLERLGDSSMVVGQNDAAIEYYGKAAEIYEGAGEAKKAGRTYTKMGVPYYFGRYDLRMTTEVRDRGVKLLEKEGESVELAEAYSLLAIWIWFFGQFSSVNSLCQKALRLAEKSEVRSAVCEAYAYAALGLNCPVTEMDKMFEYLHKSLQISTQESEPITTSIAHLNLGLAYFTCKAEKEKAMKILEEGRQYSKSVGYQWGDLWIGAHLGPVYLETGQLEKVRQLTSEILNSGSSNFPMVRGRVLGVLGHLHLREGKLVEAEKFLKDQLSMVEGSGDWQSLAWCYEGLGRLYLEKAEGIIATEYLNKEYKLFKEIGVVALRRYLFLCVLSLMVKVELKLGKSDLAMAHLQELWDNANQKYDNLAAAYANGADAVLSASQREWEKAIGSLRKSIDAWEKIGWPYELGEAYYELGVVYQQKGDMRAASESLNRALELFTPLGARLEMERVLGRKELLKA